MRLQKTNLDVGCHVRWLCLAVSCTGIGCTTSNLSESDDAGVSTIESDEEMPRFQEIDTNQDGYLNFGEVQGFPAFKAAFGALDANRDGRVDEEEYGRFRNMNVDRANDPSM